MKNYLVPFAYEMYGRIEVQAENKQAAIKEAWKKLDEMSTTDMNEAASYLDGSAEIDTDGQIITQDYPASVKITDIDWDIDPDDMDASRDLPKEVLIPGDTDEDEIADVLSDRYGWCVRSFAVKEVLPAC